MGYTGIIASQLIRIPVPNPLRVWDASDADTVRRSDGTPAAILDTIGAWLPRNGDAVNATWTPRGLGAATLETQSSISDTGGRVGIRSPMQNALYMPSSALLLTNNTWVVAFRWMAAPTFSHVFSKAILSATSTTTTSLFRSNGNDSFSHGANVVIIPGTPAPSINTVYVAVLQVAVGATSSTLRLRLSHPNELYTVTVPFQVAEDTAHPWTLGGVLSNMDSTHPNASDILVHEVRLFEGLIGNAQIREVTQILKEKWR